LFASRHQPLLATNNFFCKWCGSAQAADNWEELDEKEEEQPAAAAAAKAAEPPAADKAAKAAAAKAAAAAAAAGDDEEAGESSEEDEVWCFCSNAVMLPVACCVCPVFADVSERKISCLLLLVHAWQ
jgi:hypothetical protein